MQSSYIMIFQPENMQKLPVLLVMYRMEYCMSDYPLLDILIIYACEEVGWMLVVRMHTFTTRRLLRTI